MKTILSGLFILCIFICSCNNDTKDSVEKADSANKARLDSNNGNTNSNAQIQTDEASSSFLVKAANGGMMEVQAGGMAEQKALNASVKDFGSMMVHDHSVANDKVKTLASQRNVSLPGMVGDDEQKMMTDLGKKSGRDFDKAYINSMVKDHEKDIKEFEDAAEKVTDADVKTFINTTLPILRTHLDSAKAIQKRLK
jgi:putative membrane protein